MASGGIWATIPVKAFRLAKQRLAPAHSAPDRGALAQAMLEDVLAAVAAVPRLAGIIVATVDPVASRIAGSVGARVHRDAADAGLTAALGSVARRLAAEGAAGMLVLPGDIPPVTADDISRLLSLHGQGTALTLVRSHDGAGTNALLASPPDAIAFAWGAGSFAAHVAAARAVGIEPACVDIETIAHDIDVPEDVERLIRGAVPSRTLDFLLGVRQGRPRPAPLLPLGTRR